MTLFTKPVNHSSMTSGKISLNIICHIMMVPLVTDIALPSVKFSNHQIEMLKFTLGGHSVGLVAQPLLHVLHCAKLEKD